MEGFTRDSPVMLISIMYIMLLYVQQVKNWNVMFHINTIHWSVKLIQIKKIILSYFTSVMS